jgi:hypothetical protein
MTAATGLLAEKFCGMKLPLQVCESAAGFYLGTKDENGFPVTRESIEYFTTRELAEAAHSSGSWTQKEQP